MTNRSELNLIDRITVIHATLNSDASIEVSNSFNDTSNVDLNSKLFDFVVSNPPYVPTKQIPKLQPEIKM